MVMLTPSGRRGTIASTPLMMTRIVCGALAAGAGLGAGATSGRTTLPWRCAQGGMVPCAGMPKGRALPQGGMSPGRGVMRGLPHLLQMGLPRWMGREACLPTGMRTILTGRAAGAAAGVAGAGLGAVLGPQVAPGLHSQGLGAGPQVQSGLSQQGLGADAGSGATGAGGGSGAAAGAGAGAG